MASFTERNSSEGRTPSDRKEYEPEYTVSGAESDPLQKSDSAPAGPRYLKNPLPVPKRRAHVRMDFDLNDDWEIPEELSHFDYEIAEDDDFDI